MSAMNSECLCGCECQKPCIAIQQIKQQIIEMNKEQED